MNKLARATKQAESFNIYRHLKARGFRELGRLNFAAPRFENPTFPGGIEAISQPLYDSMTVAVNTLVAKTTLFSVQVGASGKTLAQTNMLQPNSLPAPQKIDVKALRIYVSNNTTIVDLQNILTSLSVTLNIGKKAMFEGFVGLLTAGIGGTVQAAAQVGTAPAGTAVVQSTSNGVPDQRNVFSLPVPFTIGYGELIQCIINPESAVTTQANSTNPVGTGFTLYFIMDGIFYRAIQ